MSDKKTERFSDIYKNLHSSMRDEFSDMGDDEYEEVIKKKSQELYEFENEMFEKHNDKEKRQFNSSNFISEIINNTSDSIYENTRLDDKYINNIIKYPSEYKNEILQVSYAIYNLVQEYKGLIKYQGDMLNYRAVLNPITDDVTKEKFIDALKFFEGYHYRDKLNEITKRVLMNDVYFGYIYSRRGSRNKILKEMPKKFCRLLGTDEFGVKQYKFNLDFFTHNPEMVNKYPQEFKAMYNAYKEKDSNMSKWFVPDTKKQFAIKFDNTIDEIVPFFSGLFVEMVRLQLIKDAQAKASENENYKLIWQKIPINEKSGEQDDLIVSYDFAKNFHNNITKNVPEGMGVITTPMDLDSIVMKNPNDVSSNIVDRHFGNLLSSAGISRLLFNSDKSGSTGVKQSLKVDEAQMFKLLRRYEALFNRELFYKYNGHKFNVKFLNSTNHNEEEVVKRYLQASQNGFNKFYLSAALDISQLELLYGNSMEDKLGVNDLLSKPLVSSYTQGDAGDDEQVSESGEQSQDNGEQ